MSLALPKAQGKRDDLGSTSFQNENEVKPKVKALADAGVTKAEAHRAEKLAKKSKESQEAHVAKAVESVEKRNNHGSLAEQFTGEKGDAPRKKLDLLDFDSPSVRQRFIHE
jgi:hypothetical protein